MARMEDTIRKKQSSLVNLVLKSVTMMSPKKGSNDQLKGQLGMAAIPHGS